MAKLAQQLLFPVVAAGVMVWSAAAEVVFTQRKITAGAADGSTRVFEASSMGADSFTQFARAPSSSDFGFAVVRASEGSTTPYASEVIIVGPHTALHMFSDQSVASWRFVDDHRVRLCSAPLHGPAAPTCATYRVPE